MIPWKLPSPRLPRARPTLAAVSYLNTVPLVWGMLRGPQRDAFDLSFCVPAECARRLESGRADLGIVPVVEIERQRLEVVPGTGIACDGPVRSILLISKVDPRKITSLATDSGSRTSVQLARVILRLGYGAEPRIFSHDPHWEQMLDSADAALLIGDAALAIDPPSLPYLVLDLGAEWLRLTGLPMVFALWAGPPARVAPLLDHGIAPLFRASLDFGLRHLDDIVRAEAPARGFSPELVRDYLTRNVTFLIGARQQQGLETFLAQVSELDSLVSFRSGLAP